MGWPETGSTWFSTVCSRVLMSVQSLMLNDVSLFTKLAFGDTL